MDSQGRGEGSAALDARGRRLSLGIAISSALPAGLSVGLTWPLLTLILERDGVGATMIGLNSAVSALAIVVSAPMMPWLIGRIGTLPAMWLGILVAVAAILLLPVFPGLEAWFVLRFILGVGAAVHWVVSETWINAVVTERGRGQVMGIYVTFYAGGLAGGPLVLGLTGIEGELPFLVGAAILAFAALPLLLARGVAPPLPHRGRVRLGLLLAAAPIALATALVAGFSDSASFALLPVYSLRNGFSQEAAVAMLSVFVAGNLGLQIPLGWIADRVDRRLVLMVCAAAGVAGPLALPLAIGAGWVLWPLLFVWGGTVVGLYTIGLTLLGQRFGAGEIAAANAAFVTIYEIGGILGPPVAGGAMSALGPEGLVLTLALACGAFLLFCARRRARPR